MRDFAIHLTHRPGELARVTNALARKGVNLKSVAAVVMGNQGVLRLIADNVEAARAALSENNIPFEENEVVTVLLENHAGELENVADKLAKANINIHAIYVVGLDGDLVDLALAVDDPKKAKKTVRISGTTANPALAEKHRVQWCSSSTCLHRYTHGVRGLWREHDCPTAAHSHPLLVPVRRPASDAGLTDAQLLER
jgi:hypothetical protein